MAQHVFVYPRINKERRDNSHDEGARGKTTCIPKRKCGHSCDHIENFVQNVQNSPNDENILLSSWYDHPEPGCIPNTVWAMGMVRIRMRMDL